MQKERNSNIEILRIISMLMIIGHHFIYYGVMQTYNKSIINVIYGQGSFINKMIAQLLLPGGIIGVGIFFTIAGYYGIQSDKINIISIVRDTLFYSISGLIIYIFLGIFNIVELNDIMKVVIKCINPISNSTYWFVSVYIIITFIKPVLNQYIRKLRKNYLFLGLILLIGYYMIARYNSAYYLGILNGILFYYLGALIKISGEKVVKIKNRFFWLGISIVSWFLYVLFNNMTWFGLYRISWKFSLLGICIWGTVCVYGCVIFCLSNKEFSNKIINGVAGSTLLVYLIHEHPLLREILWSKILHVESVQWKSLIFAFYAIISIIAVFSGSVAIDLFIKKILFKKCNIIYDKFNLKKMIWINDRRL